ncbi:sodium-dependent dopamine transporter-like [Penaeus japonicus]|uniref:sodium-dependent dopamine transporter-like n=1 Tax=Penaeus japonicus TaxID=27405 RepID=UPI001C70DE8F|nr:sodium-dependent dopamine transporter-like [Penaeus japonicus]
MASTSDKESDGKGRENWSHKCDYLFMMIGYAIGIGNVWRFPYLCYINGGGAFLVPYLLTLVLVGIPVFFLETVVGQFSTSSCLSLYSVCPAFKGIGMASLTINLITIAYYILLVSYPLLFLAHSFSWELPWASCGNSWNSPNCTVSTLFGLTAPGPRIDMASTSDKESDGKGRENWSHKCDYLFMMIGYAIGIGNVWRFPYLCYINGGGAFLVPYLLTLVLVGIPVFFLETVVGQFSTSSCLSLYSVCPAFKGIGMASLTINLITIAYYILLVSYPLLFLAHSFSWELPWASCGNSWNSPNCTGDMKSGVSAADEFFHRKILHASSGIHELGGIEWPVVGVTFLTMAFLFFCIFKGVRIMGKVVWFTAIFPFVMLFILLIRGVTLPGAADGIYFYIYPKFDKLREMKVWAAAAMQIFYSLGPGWGSLISFSSYNKFHNRCTRDAVIVPILNCSASILSGFVVFSVLGFMAKRAGVSVEEVAVAGPSLVFVIYPEALSLMPVAPFWSVLFFLMLFFLGIDACFAHIETPVICLLDEFPKLRGCRGWVTFFMCLCCFLLTTLFVTNGGIYWLTLVDWYCATFTIIIVCLCQTSIFSYIYGVGRTLQDLQLMLRSRVSYAWWITWLATPFMVLSFFLNAALNHTGAGYRGQAFPTWAQGVGWLISFSSIQFIPLYFLYYFCFRTAGSFKQRLKSCLSPSPAWGPAQESHREEWMQHRHKHPLRSRFLHPDLCAVTKTNTSPDDVLLNTI